jgi:hypothetical protein
MRRTGSSLESIAQAHYLRQGNRTIIQKGGEDLLSAIPQSIEVSNLMYLGTYIPLFIVSVDNPDDTVTMRWVL